MKVLQKVARAPGSRMLSSLKISSLLNSEFSRVPQYIARYMGKVEFTSIMIFFVSFTISFLSLFYLFLYLAE
jgi:hypothetical protein